MMKKRRITYLFVVLLSMGTVVFALRSDEIALGRELYHQGKYTEAVRILEKYVNSYSGNKSNAKDYAEANYILAKIYYEASDNLKVAEFLRKALIANPEIGQDETSGEFKDRVEKMHVILFSNKKTGEDKTGPDPVQKISLRSNPRILSEKDVLTLLRENDLFCGAPAWNTNFHNLEGKGVKHRYEPQSINSDRVVLDYTTGLMWHQSGSKYLTYKDAKEWLQELNEEGYAGFWDWRLPTIEECVSLMERVKDTNQLFINPIFSPMQNELWTVDTLPEGPLWGRDEFAYVVFFKDISGLNNQKIGFVASQAVDKKSAAVRPVRNIK